MDSYTFKGTARQRGAIGIMTPFTLTVIDESIEAARLRLYDHLEHIFIHSIETRDENGDLVAIDNMMGRSD